MKHSLGLSLLGLILLSGCIPVAMLRPAAPENGSSFTVGGSAVVPLASGTIPGAIVLPYLAFARGDGETEFNLSAQLGLRGGIKQKIADGVSLDAGLTIPYILVSGGGTGTPLAIDGGIIVGVDQFYVSPRVQWIGFTVNNSLQGGVLYQVAAGYSDAGLIFELGGTFSGGGGVLLEISAAARF